MDTASIPRLSRNLCTRKDAAELLGVSTRTIDQWVAQGRIIGYRVTSRVVRIDLDSVNALVEKAATR